MCAHEAGSADDRYPGVQQWKSLFASGCMQTVCIYGAGPVLEMWV